MRINSDLEKALLDLEESSAENCVSLLDTIKAFEKAYKRINESFMKNEKIFSVYDSNEGYTCKKTKYDPVLGKTIYNVYKTKDMQNVSILDIEVSNIGDVSFSLNDSNSKEAEALVEKLNEPSNKLMEKIKMNADISFFTENRELMLSKKPYLALKMGNFVEEDKAVLVYKEEGTSNQINKTNTGVQYIRVDQIEGYLKNIKVDERTIPALAYAFIGNDYERYFIDDLYKIERTTYPNMSKEKAEEYKSYRYQNALGKRTYILGVAGFFVGAIVGTAIGLETVLPFMPSLLVGAGAPLTATGLMYANGLKKIKKASQKDKRLREAVVLSYGALKKYSNENIAQLEKQFTKKREKQNKKFSLNKFENVNVSELIHIMRQKLSQENPQKATFCNIALAQILNAYVDENTTKQEKIKNNSELYGELIELGNIISDLDNTPMIDVVDYTIDIVNRLIPKVDPNETIKILNVLEDARCNKTSLVHINHKVKWAGDIDKCYFEALLLSAAQEDGISVETVSSIDTYKKEALISKLKIFADKIYYSDVPIKRDASIEISNEINGQSPQELKIIKTIKKIYITSNLSYDLIGKPLIDEKVKIKENPQK